MRPGFSLKRRTLRAPANSSALRNRRDTFLTRHAFLFGRRARKRWIDSRKWCAAPEEAISKARNTITGRITTQSFSKTHAGTVWNFVTVKRNERQGRLFYTVTILRLSWAGIQISQNDFTLFIDPLENVEPLAGFLGKPQEQLFPIAAPAGRAAALVTHIHSDHFDPLDLRRLLGSEGCVYGPEAVVQKAKEDLTANAATPQHSFQVGPFEVIAVPAMDWRGDDQVSWVVKSNGARFSTAATLSGTATGGVSRASTDRSRLPSCRSTASSFRCLASSQAASQLH